MSASTTLYLRNFKGNDFLAWHVATQCAYNCTVVLKDDKKQYFSARKSSGSSSLQIIEEGHDTYVGGASLRVEITVDQSRQTDLDVSQSNSAIMDKQSNPVGFVYDYCVEDAGDKDYNDIYINVVGWNKKG